MLFVMAIDMDLDLIGRPGPQAEMMRNMDPRMDMYMPMARFWPLFAMWAIMMAAMMLPTMVPTLRAYEDLMLSADGTRAGQRPVRTEPRGANRNIVGVAFDHNQRHRAVAFANARDRQDRITDEQAPT